MRLILLTAMLCLAGCVHSHKPVLADAPLPTHPYIIAPAWTAVQVSASPPTWNVWLHAQTRASEVFRALGCGVCTFKASGTVITVTRRQ